MLLYLFTFHSVYPSVKVSSSFVSNFSLLLYQFIILIVSVCVFSQVCSVSVVLIVPKMPGNRGKDVKKVQSDRPFRPSHTYVPEPHSPRSLRDVPATMYEEYDSTVGTPAVQERNRLLAEEERLLDQECRQLRLNDDNEESDEAYARDAAARRARLTVSTDQSVQSGYLGVDQSTPVSSASTGTVGVACPPLSSTPGVAGSTLPTGAQGVSKAPGSSDQLLAVMLQMMSQQQEQSRMMFAQQQEQSHRHEEQFREERAERLRRQERDDARQQSFLDALQTSRDSEVESRRETDRRSEKKDLKSDLLKGLGNYKEGSHLVSYITKFESVMSACSIDRETWIERLSANMPDTLSAKVSSLRSEGATYDEVKEYLLRAVGETNMSYGFKLFDPNYDKLKSLGPTQFSEYVSRMLDGVLHGASNYDEYKTQIGLAFTRQVFPHDGRAFLRSRTIKTWRDLASAQEEWISSRQDGNFYRPRVSGGSGVSGSGGGNSQSSHSKSNVSRNKSSQSANDSGNSSGSSGPVVCYNCKEEGHRAFECPTNEGKKRKVICHACKKEGHYAPDCKEKKTTGKGSTPKLSQLWAGKVSSRNTVTGSVNGQPCEILIDSGADVALVPRCLIGHDVVEGGVIKASGFFGGADSFSSTQVVFHIAGRDITELAVIDEISQESLCLIPFHLDNSDECQLFSKAIRESRVKSGNVSSDDTVPSVPAPEPSVPAPEPSVNVLTRAGAREERLLDTNEVEVHNDVVGSVAEVTVDEVSSTADLGETLVELSLGVPGEAGVSQASECVDEESVVDGVVNVSSQSSDSVPNVSSPSSASESCSPNLFDELSECPDAIDAASAELIKVVGDSPTSNSGVDFKCAVRSDNSINTWRSLADRGERGFKWRDGLLIKEMLVDWEERCQVIVVPKLFRDKLLVLAHDKCGHLSSDKVNKMLEKRFLWPGMSKDVSEYCRGCGTCQLKSKFRPRKAPAVERPVLSEPFESVAVDLVGPLPKGKGGARYLLTYVCMATRWPEAIPLRSITARSVADGLLEIFSRTGIPEKILTDQGSQFMGKVMSSLCELLGIDRVRTSPYHPQSNGVVERMHGTLKSVLGKSMSSEKDWVAFVPLCLFVLRQMPHADTGLSPFDLIYGFKVRTPLDVLYSCLSENHLNGSGTSYCDWVSQLAERLDMVRDQAALKEAVAKAGRMSYLNQGTKLRSFSVNEQVLYRVPGRTSKLSDSWEGPFVVTEVIGKVNYRIAKPGATRHNRVVHVNSLRKFVDQYSINRLDVVVDDSEPESIKLDGECVGFRQSDLDKLFDRFSGLFSSGAGLTKVVQMSIDTGTGGPISQAPYSVPLGIRAKVKAELDSLLEQGIIERSSSSWSSPLVPVRKPDGSLRLCVDYRKVNSITVKEPYFIPTFSEMLELVGQGAVLSKIDLAKGFHQIEVCQADREKTAFSCPFGKFHYRRMPFGLTNAPSVFQRTMDVVLAEFRSCSRVYIDDILVVSNSWDEHMSDLEKVFSALSEAGLKCKLSKCEFGKAKLEFLGHWIGGGVVSVPEARVTAVRNHPRPHTRRQLRSFLGLLSYFRQFIKSFHKFSSILTPHTSGPPSEALSWTGEMLQAFEGLRVSLCDKVVLCVPCVSDVFRLETDACCSGVGGVLSVYRDSVWMPAGFFSRQLHGAQARYSAQELECLAVWESVKHFSYFLYGRKFTVLTDHKSLVNLKSGKQNNRRIQGWALKLSEYEFDVEYRKGVENGAADCLSRAFEPTSESPSVSTSSSSSKKSSKSGVPSNDEVRCPS